MRYQSKAVYDLAVLRDYKLKLKLVLLRKVRQGRKKQRKDVNDEKLDNNISRARSKVIEYGLCNEWEYFCTFTIDPSKYDRFDLEKYHRTLAQWIRDYNKKHGTKIKYLLVPEKHESGGWHEHGLLLGISKKHLRHFTLQEHIPRYIRQKLETGQEIYDWPDYRQKFGYLIIEPIRDRIKATNYISKYITKDINQSISDVGAHLYYVSRGLETSREIKRGSLRTPQKFDFENDYIKIKWFDKNIITDGLII